MPRYFGWKERRAKSCNGSVETILFRRAAPPAKVLLYAGKMPPTTTADSLTGAFHCQYFVSLVVDACFDSIDLALAISITSSSESKTVSLCLQRFNLAKLKASVQSVVSFSFLWLYTLGAVLWFAVFYWLIFISKRFKLLLSETITTSPGFLLSFNST